MAWHQGGDKLLITYLTNVYMHHSAQMRSGVSGIKLDTYIVHKYTFTIVSHADVSV